MNWHPPLQEYVYFTRKRHHKGQLIQPARGRLFEVVEKVFPFVYIIRRRSWRHD